MANQKLLFFVINKAEKNYIFVAIPQSTKICAQVATPGPSLLLQTQQLSKTFLLR